MSESTLRWGVISTANIGRAAVNPAIQASNNGELVAVASRDPARAREFAEQWGIRRHYGSYQALLDDPNIDAVYNPLPNSLHAEWTVKAASAGKHILCEKPLALNEAECRQMAAAADANGVKLLEAFMYRFHPRTQRVLEMVRSGDVGDLKVIRSSFTFPRQVNPGTTLAGRQLLDTLLLQQRRVFTVQAVQVVKGLQHVAGARRELRHRGPRQGRSRNERPVQLLLPGRCVDTTLIVGAALAEKVGLDEIEDFLPRGNTKNHSKVEERRLEILDRLERIAEQGSVMNESRWQT